MAIPYSVKNPCDNVKQDLDFEINKLESFADGFGAIVAQAEQILCPIKEEVELNIIFPPPEPIPPPIPPEPQVVEDFIAEVNANVDDAIEAIELYLAPHLPDYTGDDPPLTQRCLDSAIQTLSQMKKDPYGIIEEAMVNAANIVTGVDSISLLIAEVYTEGWCYLDTGEANAKVGTMCDIATCNCDDPVLVQNTKTRVTEILNSVGMVVNQSECTATPNLTLLYEVIDENPLVYDGFPEMVCTIIEGIQVSIDYVKLKADEMLFYITNPDAIIVPEYVPPSRVCLS